MTLRYPRSQNHLSSVGVLCSELGRPRGEQLPKPYFFHAASPVRAHGCSVHERPPH